MHDALAAMRRGNLIRLQRCLRDRADTVDTVVHAPLTPPTRSGYRRWLCDLFRFISPVEKSVALTPGLDRRLMRGRHKASRLASDLMALGLTKAERTRLANRCHVPELHNPLEALGWLFVVERLTLQFDRLQSQLWPHIAFELDTAGSFLVGYGDELLHSWMELDRAVDRMIASESDMDLVTQASFAALDLLETTASGVENVASVTTAA